jgi:hypothetical protein
MFMPRAQIGPFFKKLVVMAVLSGLIIAPFLIPYLKVKQEHRFARTVESNIQFSANILGYLTISRFNKNVFYEARSVKNRVAINTKDRGKLRPKGRGLFPGILTIVLVLAAFLFPPYASRFPAGSGMGGKSRSQTALKIVNFGLLFVVVLAGIILFSGGWGFSFLGIRVSLTSLTNPLYLILVLLVLKLILFRVTSRDFDDEMTTAAVHRHFYVFLGVFTFIMSLGPKIFYITHDFGRGPYMFLYENIVLFKGIRVPERFGIFVMLALCVLAGYGVAKMSLLIKKRGAAILTCLFLVFLIYEFICVPFPYEKIPREPDEVYRWLASTKEQFAILEYPLIKLQTNKYYMYWSIFHRKKLANGSSGFNPPVFNQLREIAHQEGPFPHREFIQYVKMQVPVKYLILHLESFSGAEKEAILDNVSRFPDDLRLVRTFEPDDHVFEVIY